MFASRPLTGLAAVCLCRTVARRLQGVQGKYGRRDERAKQRRPCASNVDAEMLVLCRLGAAALAPRFRPSRAEVRILCLLLFLCCLALICLPLRCFLTGRRQSASGDLPAARAAVRRPCAAACQPSQLAYLTQRDANCRLDVIDAAWRQPGHS